MQVDLLELLRSGISNKRFEPYLKQGFGVNDPHPYACYIWNMSLSESLYPSLQALEVTLRNSIHDVASKAFNNEMWFEDQLDARDKDMLTEVKSRLTEGKKPIEAGRIVAGLTLGFWVSLLDRRYEQVLWPRLLEDVFPHMPRQMRTQKNLSVRLNRIRHLRNRVFHYEPIWHWKDLPEQHDEILEVIGWINSSMLELVRVIDRFREVHKLGMQTCERDIVGLLSRCGENQPRT